MSKAKRPAAAKRKGEWTERTRSPKGATAEGAAAADGPPVVAADRPAQPSGPSSGQLSVQRAPSSRPPGQRLWDMPYSAVAPRMINPAIGLHNLVARAGHNAGYDIDLTLLDAPDHRMIRSGVLLAHRVLDERGEWYLGAPDWVPLLPKERIEQMGHGDLPDELADLIRPFRRRAALGPVAALRCERREFALRDDRGVTKALLRDDKVTVRRGGLTTARYREVMMTPIGPGLTPEQDDWLASVLGGAGATRVERFPRLVHRLGAPANGLTDYPSPAALQATMPFDLFVAGLVGRRLRKLLEADLAWQADRPGAAGELADAATRLRRELATVAPALPQDRTTDLDEELAWLADQAAPPVDRTGAAPSGATNGGGVRSLRSERYLTLLERLVTASRATRSAAAGRRSTGEVLEGMLGRAWRRLGKASERLEDDASADAWAETRTAMDQVLAGCDLIEELEPGRFAGLRRRLERTGELLDRAEGRAAELRQLRDRVGQVSPAEAFELGRRYEREVGETRAAREAYTVAWAKTAGRLSLERRPADGAS